MLRLAIVIAAVACTNPTPVPVATPATPGTGPRVTRVDLEAQPIVDAWAEAVGGRQAIAALGALHGKGTYEKGGIVGTIELWQTPRGERREVIELGPLRTTRVFDGTRGWLVDRNREVRELAGWEIGEQLTLAFFDAHAPLVVDRRPGEVTRIDDKLVLTPTGGTRPDTVAFDRNTQLPVTRVRRDGEKLRTTTLSDWNAVEGVRLPFTVREQTDNPHDSITIHWRTLQAKAPPPNAFTRPADRESDATVVKSPVVVPIEVAHGGLVFVTTSINDTPMSFVLDTGAEATVLNASRLTKLGLQAVGKFATGAGGGDVVLTYVTGVTTKVGDATVSDQIVAAIALDHLEHPLQRPLDGILGYDFLSRFVVELDYANQTMRLHDRAMYHHTGAGKPLPITLEDGTPFLDAAISVPSKGEITGRFVLDTGCLCDVQLSTPFVDQHRLLEAFPHARQAGYSTGAGGATHELTATIPSLKIGDQVIKDPRADFARDNHGVSADPESAGLIGSLTWKRYVLVLDYKHQQVFLDPPR